MQQHLCFENTTSHMWKWDRSNRFLRILQRQTRKGGDGYSVTIHLENRQDNSLDEQPISLNIGAALFQSCQPNSNPLEVLRLRPNVRGLLLLSSRQIRVETWSVIPRVTISQMKWIHSKWYPHWCCCIVPKCQHLCDIICHSQWMMDESVSVIHLHSFPHINE